MKLYCAWGSCFFFFFFFFFFPNRDWRFINKIDYLLLVGFECVLVVTWVPTIVVGVRYNYKSFSLSLEGIFFITWSKNRTHRHRVCLKCGPFCYTSTEARWLIRDGDRRGRGRNRPKKTGETVDRRQNNGNIKAVSPRHCPATCALRSCCFNCCAGQSHKDNVRCTAVDKQLGQLEAKDVQLSQASSTSLLMISSGLT